MLDGGAKLCLRKRQPLNVVLQRAERFGAIVADAASASGLASDIVRRYVA